MNILFVSSEVTPYAKTGGLADVCGSLPIELNKLGHNVAVMMPAYRQTKGHPGIEPLNIKFDVPIGNKIVRGRLLRSTLPNSEVPIFFIEQDDYFDRPELYRHKGEDFKDNCERFAFFCRAALEAIRILKLDVEVIHCHDWQTCLIPAYLHIEYAHCHGYETIGSLLTIHNLAYQGIFWHWDMLLTGLDWKYFNWHQMEFYGKLNLLKTGLTFADGLNTVSPTYAQEIQTDPLGCGLEGVLQSRADVLCGIVNGVHYAEWDPAHDTHLPYKYDVSNWQSGKAACKSALQAELGLPVSPRTPVIGLVGRLSEQKGWDLVTDLMRRWVREVDVQWAILGTGEMQYHDILAQLAREYPHRVGLRLDFNEGMSHRIEAGSDIFLMPSRYEPCGLNQLYSLKYGTVPVVRATGGLKDTVADANDENLWQQRATGFSFDNYSTHDMEVALGRALNAYHHQPEKWQQIVETGMKQDWSWRKSALEYVELYQDVHERRLEAYERLQAML
ncbi:Glycogen synthase [Anatilimnocola aggregata]|uniref:Glycogen synthase n=1 Tax=Anatilimnocola aggregata TaxID=2528021 RepID=A0A517YBE3_9BACT|nr:glycogen synthase GlgA [Anatilimnocola aggregata]QDU27541.1 Glycogen synthase [Anatilimnocola aggregata]